MQGRTGRSGLFLKDCLTRGAGGSAADGRSAGEAGPDGWKGGVSGGEVQALLQCYRDNGLTLILYDVGEKKLSKTRWLTDITAVYFCSENSRNVVKPNPERRVWSY